jgi:hypothetical protein
LSGDRWQHVTIPFGFCAAVFAGDGELYFTP